MTSEFPARNEIGSSARRGVGSPARVHVGCAVQDEDRISCTKPGRDRVHEGRSAYRPDARNRVGLGCARPEGAARNQVGTFTNYHAKVTPKNSREFFYPLSPLSACPVCPTRNDWARRRFALFDAGRLGTPPVCRWPRMSAAICTKGGRPFKRHTRKNSREFFHQCAAGEGRSKRRGGGDGQTFSRRFPEKDMLSFS